MKHQTNKFYLFGSELINKLTSNKFRPSRDTDYITNDINAYNGVKSTKNVEYHYIPFIPDREMTLDEIYTIKCSHALRDIQWKKTMSDIRFLQLHGCKLIQSFHTELKQYWNEVHGISKRISFEVNSIEDFFNDNVSRHIVHDELHTYVIPEGTDPAYKLIVDEVIPDRNKYDQLSFEDKIKILTEEAYVLSLERYTGAPGNFLLYNEYHKAQMILITRLHPEWLAEEAISNWQHIYKPKYNYTYEFYKRTSIKISRN